MLTPLMEIRAAVVSAPSFELFAAQDPPTYRDAASVGTAPRVGVEAGDPSGMGARSCATQRSALSG